MNKSLEKSFIKKKKKLGSFICTNTEKISEIYD